MNEKKINFILYQIHIPKTGGTSLRSYFRKNIGEAMCGTIGTPFSKIDPIPTEGQFVHLHNGFFNIHQKIPNHDYRYIISLRDPVDRFCSLCLQELNNPKKLYNSLLHEIAQSTKTSWKQPIKKIFWDKLIEQIDNKKLNTQLENTYCLTLSTEFDTNMNPKRLDKSILCQKAIDNLINNQNKIAFIFTDNFVESFKKSMIRIGVPNMEWDNRHNHLVKTNQYKSEFNTEHRNVLEKYFVQDYELYNFIKNSFYLGL